MNLLLILLVGLAFNQATAVEPVETPRDIKVAVEKSLATSYLVDYSKLND